MDPGTGKHAHQGIDAKKIDPSTNKIADPRLSDTEQLGSFSLGERAFLDELTYLDQERRTNPKVFSFIVAKAQIGEYISASLAVHEVLRMDEPLTILLGLIGALGIYLAMQLMSQRSSAPSSGMFVRACRREFRFLVDEYGFAVESLVFFGTREPFGCRFQGPKFAVIVQGIQWGAAVHVYFETGHPEAECATELERLRSTNSEEKLAASEVAKRFDVIRMRSQLPAHWLLDQRLPGWHHAENNQLAEIHDYAAALRKCAGDLFSGDQSALSELFVRYAEHRPQQDSHDRQEMAILFAQEAARPRTVLEQVKIAQGIRRTISYLGTECTILLRALSKDQEPSSLLRFVQSWQALANCLRDETVRFKSVQSLETSSRIMEGLRNAEKNANLVRAALASGQANRSLTERVAALDQQGKELLLALDLALERLSRA